MRVRVVHARVHVLTVDVQGLGYEPCNGSGKQHREQHGETDSRSDTDSRDIDSQEGFDRPP